MSPNLPPPPPPLDPATPSKKGPSPLLYVGIGCGALTLIAIVAVVLGLGYLGKKASGIIADVQKNPAKFAAEMIVKSNPELELIASDDTKGQISFRNKSTGESITLSYDDVANGRLTVKKGDEEVQIDGPQGSVKVKGPDGTSVAEVGRQVALPDWVPAFPGLTVADGGLRSTVNGRESIRLVATSDQGVQDIAAFFNDELDQRGFTMTRQAQSAAESTTEILEGSNDATHQSITLSITRSNPQEPARIIIATESPAP